MNKAEALIMFLTAVDVPDFTEEDERAVMEDPTIAAAIAKVANMNEEEYAKEQAEVKKLFQPIADAYSELENSANN